MTFPPDLNLIAVTGTYTTITGSPLTGYVNFSITTPVTDPEGHVIFNISTQSAALNSSGSFNIIIPCTDNTDLAPAFTYLVTEVIPGLGRAYYVSLPHTLGSSVDISELAPTSAPPATNAFNSPNTWTATQAYSGSPGLQITTGASEDYILTSDADGNATWQPGEGGGGAVDSVFGRTGVVAAHTGDYTPAQVGALSLGGGSVSGTVSIAGSFATVPVVLTDASTITVDASTSDYFRVTLGGNRTLGAPSNPVDGQSIVFEIIQDGTGSRTLAYNAVYSVPSSIGTPVLSTSAGFHDFLSFRYDSGTATWYCQGFVPQQAAASPLTVSQGGTGNSALTAYSILTGGTTSTGAVQSVSGLGSSSNVLTSNGPAELPTWQSSPGQWFPADNGLLAATDLLSVAVTTLQPVAGTLYMVKLPVRSAFTATNIWVVVGTAGSGTSTGSFIGLYNSSGTLLSGSSDIGTQLANGFTARQIALTTPQSLTAGTFVWVAMVINMPTMPFLRQLNNGTVLPNINLSAAAYRSCTNGTGLTALPGTITPSANAGSLLSPFWFGIS